ncbi:MAG: hypothetical protein IJ423_01995 [Clostridia bacterium]|nr:hypothetical protein [Clostridia bacterium]
MLTNQDAPWIEYLIIDEDTRKRVLRKDTPDDIREKYEKYQAIINQQVKSGEALSK